MELNPTRILDQKMEEKIKNENIGKIREKEYLGMVDNEIGIYEIITTDGYYHIYISEKENDINIEGIKDLINNRNIYMSEKMSEIYQKLDAPIIAFFIEEPEYGENIEKIDGNTITYKNNKILKFDIQYYKVYQVYNVTEEEMLEYTCSTLIEFKDDFQKIINKKMYLFKNVEEIISYEVDENYISYTFKNFCGNIYKIVKDLDGNYDIQASNNNISNEYMEKLWKERGTK